MGDNMLELEDIFYFYNINSIGGVETFFYQLAKRFEDRDITVIFNTGDETQVKRLKKYVRVIKYKNEKIKCKKAYFNYNTNIIDNVEANEYIGLIHADYKNIPYKPNTHPKLTKFIAVSETAKKSFEDITGKKCEVIYNPYETEKTKRILNLISTTRLTKEKGKDRMVKLGEELNKGGIPYLWIVFTNDIKEIDNPNIVYMKPRLDIIDYVANADYLVQLSSAEAYCYSIVESLSVGTPVITTNLPVLKEIGVNENNSFILDFNMSNLDVDKIYEKADKFNFTYTPPKSEWEKEITKKKSTYKEELEKMKKIKALQNYTDTVLNKNIVKGEEYIVDNERAEVITNYIFKGNPIAEVIEDIKEEVKEPTEDKIVEKMKEGTKKKTTKKKTTTKKKVAKKK
ncbi:MAG TPA: glycosyltransferase [Gallicola sp.]|nr:glycosyltransferase [Gallicola sp.]